MKFAHFAAFSPNLSGMYATVKDLIRAERLQGIEAEFIDYGIDNFGKTFSKVGYQDEDIVSVSPDWAYKNADILIRHSMFTEPIARVGIPLIMAMHGRPEYSYMLEHYGSSPVMKIMCNHETDAKYSAYISFWEEHELFWSLMMPKRKIHYLPSVVDLKKFNPEGEQYGAGKWTGHPNILICDMWREDITPLSVLMASAKFKQKYCPEAKVQLFGLPPAGKGFISEFAERLRSASLIEDANAIVPFLPAVYRSADILVTPHSIATRVVREALASGLPIVAGSGCKYTPYTADPRDPEAFAYQINCCWENLQDCKAKVKSKARKVAEQSFNYDFAGKAMLELGQKILSKGTNNIATLPIEWSGFSITPTDWVVLRDVLRRFSIKRAVEFGAGVSTQLMDRMGIQVLSFETDPIHIEKIKRLVRYAKFILWNGVYPPVIDENYQLAFIDGPFGGEKREAAYKAVANSSIPFVACHDYKRREDSTWITMYFGGWNEIARADESIPGLIIFERPK